MYLEKNQCLNKTCFSMLCWQVCDGSFTLLYYLDGMTKYFNLSSRFWCFQAIIINIIFAKVGLGNVEMYYYHH